MVLDIILYVLLGLVGLLLIAMLVRTLLTKKPSIPPSSYTPKAVDKDHVASVLSKAVQFETVTLTEQNQDGKVFLDYQAFLEESYPLITKLAKKVTINSYSVAYIVDGSDPSLLPIGILAHQDVVPAESEGWEVPPFSGEIKDGFVYGRGSQDMKSQMVAALEGLELLLKDGFLPKRGIYFLFGHDEELRGTEGAKNISQYLQEQGVRFEFVLDEGGTILDGKMLGIPGKIALIGTCEKGYADFRLEVNKVGGHASSPTKRTAVGLLSEAVYEVEKRQRKSFWAKPTKQMIRSLAPHMNPVFKFLFVNHDILSPLLRFVLSKAHPMTNSLVRTTFAPTQTAGANAPNVLPPKASANINCRINTGETLQEVQEHIEAVVGKHVTVSLEKGAIDPSPVSRIDTPAYQTLTTTIQEVFDGFVCAPFMFIAASDAKHYYNLTDCVYRFTPFEKTEDDQARIHALNERQEIDALAKGVQFYIRLYENAC